MKIITQMPTNLCALPTKEYISRTEIFSKSNH